MGQKLLGHRGLDVPSERTFSFQDRLSPSPVPTWSSVPTSPLRAHSEPSPGGDLLGVSPRSRLQAWAEPHSHCSGESGAWTCESGVGLWVVVVLAFLFRCASEPFHQQPPCQDRRQGKARPVFLIH